MIAPCGIESSWRFPLQTTFLPTSTCHSSVLPVQFDAGDDEKELMLRVELSHALSVGCDCSWEPQHSALSVMTTAALNSLMAETLLSPGFIRRS